MKKILKTMVEAIMISTLAVSMVACGSAEGQKKEEGTTEPSSTVNKYELKGSVTYALPTAWYDDSKKEHFKRFMDKYQDIEVNVVTYDSDTHSYLTTASATGELPDIIEGWNDLIYPVSTGLVQPLDEFLANDEDIKYVPQNIVDSFKIDGKTFGVPVKTVTSGMLVNLDLLDKLNLDTPSYEWTIDDFRELAKKTTTKEYSAIDTLYVLRSLLLAHIDPNLTAGGYNYDTEKFDFTSGGFRKQMDLIMELRAIPGLQADSLRNQELIDAGKEDDYQKKFGKEVNAFNDGKQFMKGAGTWDLNWGLPDFAWDFYTVPNDPEVGYTSEAGVDFLYMLNTAKDKEAAFELLKWASYGEEGTLEYLDIRDQLEFPTPYIYLPITQTDAINEKVNNSDKIPGGLKHFYNNLDKTFVSPGKFVPGFDKAQNEVLQETISRIFKGETEAGAIAPEMEEKANEIVKESWETLRKEMDKYEIYK